MSTPEASSSQPVNRHAPTAVERQRSQLEKLLKDPSKPAYVPPAPKEKTIRPAREMMKNVQGSSAGAGSGEFHVYKASRRREYERLKLLDETSQKEMEEAEFERNRRAAEEQADAKTAKNRAKRQKKKNRPKNKASPNDDGLAGSQKAETGVPLKKRRLVHGKELVFKNPGEISEEDDSDSAHEGPDVGHAVEGARGNTADLLEHTGPDSVEVVDAPRITIHEED